MVNLEKAEPSWSVTAAGGLNPDDTIMYGRETLKNRVN